MVYRYGISAVQFYSRWWSWCRSWAVEWCGQRAGSLAGRREAATRHHSSDTLKVRSSSQKVRVARDGTMLSSKVGPFWSWRKARLSPPLHQKTLPGTVHSYNLLDSPLVKLRDMYRWCLVIVVAYLHPGTQSMHNQSCLKFGSLAELLFQRGTHLPLSPLPHASLLPPEEIRASNARRVSPVNASSFLLLKLLSTSLL